ncbi:glycosyltransferase family 2 protein [bacterium]|nr:glycosyltransferase family 2 protein [bacterium]
MDKRIPLVSVIIPCFNAEKYIRYAVESILNQTYKNIEVIVINDGSNDNTGAILADYESQDGRVIRIENETNCGLIYTLNKGIAIAKGEYIARMDADDISDLSRIEKQLAFFNIYPDTDVLGTGSDYISDDHTIFKNLNPLYCQFETIALSSLFSQPLVHGSILAKANYLKNNQYDTSFKHSEDFELWLRLIHNGAVIRNIPEKLYLYRINNMGVSQLNTLDQIISHNKASKLYLEKTINKKLSEEVIMVLNNNPTSDVSLSSFKEGIKAFKLLFENSKIAESKSFRNRHLFNMHVQMVKSNRKNVFRLLSVVISLIHQPGVFIEFCYLIQRLLYRRSLIFKK